MPSKSRVYQATMNEHRRRLARVVDRGSVPQLRKLYDDAGKFAAKAAGDAANRMAALKDKWPKAEFSGDLSSDEINSALQHDRDRHRDITRAFSHGELSSDEVKELGVSLGSNLPIKLDPDRDYYHVTTGASGVLESGLKTRDELGGVASGLGGGASDTISLTDDPAVAQTIYDTMREGQQVARGEIKPIDLYNAAFEGKGAKRAFAEDLIRMHDAHHSPGDPLPSGMDLALAERRSVRANESSTDSTVPRVGMGMFFPEPALPAGAEGFNLHTTADGKTVFGGYVRGMTDEEKLDSRMEFYKRFLMVREGAGGPEDPLFYMTDYHALAAKPVEDIALLKVRATPGSQGYRMSALGEIRVYTGDVLKVTDVERRPMSSRHVAPEVSKRGDKEETAQLARLSKAKRAA